jgi:hypothetical protein
MLGAACGSLRRGCDVFYVGVSHNLAEREFDTQFAEGKTGFSTERTSIVAILEEQLGLRPRVGLAQGPAPTRPGATSPRR